MRLTRSILSLLLFLSLLSRSLSVSACRVAVHRLSRLVLYCLIRVIIPRQSLTSSQLTAHSSARIALSHPVAPSGVIVSNSTALSHPGVHRRADHSYNNDGLASMATATFFLNQTGQTGAHVVHSVSSPTTHHSSLTTHHSSLTTRHSTLTTHYSPLRPAHTPVREQCGRRRPT